MRAATAAAAALALDDVAASGAAVVAAAVCCFFSKPREFGLDEGVRGAEVAGAFGCAAAAAAATISLSDAAAAAAWWATCAFRSFSKSRIEEELFRTSLEVMVVDVAGGAARDDDEGAAGTDVLDVVTLCAASDVGDVAAACAAPEMEELWDETTLIELLLLLFGFGI